MKKSVKIVVITGAESTGKSTLAKDLAEYFHVPYIPEIARNYVEKLTKKYNYHDVETIAKMQVGQLSQFINSEHPFIFVDTWLIITKVWFEVVFKKVPEWLENEIVSTPIDLFLVCDTDIPWIPDPVRENGGENRLILQKRYIEEIKNYNFNYSIISGLDDNRLAKAVERINLLK